MHVRYGQPPHVHRRRSRETKTSICATLESALLLASTPPFIPGQLADLFTHDICAGPLQSPYRVRAALLWLIFLGLWAFLWGKPVVFFSFWGFLASAWQPATLRSLAACRRLPPKQKASERAVECAQLFCVARPPSAPKWPK